MRMTATLALDHDRKAIKYSFLPQKTLSTLSMPGCGSQDVVAQLLQAHFNAFIPRWKRLAHLQQQQLAGSL